MSLRSISLRAVVPALLALAAAPLCATSYVMVSDQALVDGSPAAAVVRVVSEDRAAGLRGGADTPATEYVVRIEEVLKGQIPGGASAVVRVPGGDARDGLALKVYGAPRFAAGDRALLFLEPAEGGAWRVMHLLLGSFREVEAGGNRLAVRDLGEARELRQTEAGIEAAPGQDRLRDFDAFARWVADRAARVERSADYFVQESGLGQITGQYRLFTDPTDGYNLRWFEFDNGGQVLWKAYKKGQTGLAGGGYAQFQSALKAWNNEPETPIDYHYDGTTSTRNGLKTYDEVNAILFNDPNAELPSFSCSTGGVLAYGGPWYYQETTNYLGKPYHAIANADVVINDGLSCFFASSPSATKAAEELFGHELGHTLGLNHSCGDSNSPDPNCANATYSDALMRAYIHDDGRGARINGDDQTGVRVLYKPGGFSVAPAAPTDLTATPQSTTEIQLIWQDKATDETGYKVERRELTGVFEEILSLPANTTSVMVGGLEPATGYAFRVRAVNAGGPSAYSNEAAASTNAPVGPCVADEHTLCLNGGRFRVQVVWETGGGSSGPASVVPVSSDDSGLLWFFAADNWEMLIKVLDGCAVNGNYWVFFAATTNVQLTITVTDTQTGRVKTYVNPQGVSAATVTDTKAFGCTH
jgi:fibronectin type III domain protein